MDYDKETAKFEAEFKRIKKIYSDVRLANVYSVSEVAEALDVYPRAVQKRCIRLGVEKVDGAYLIWGRHFKEMLQGKINALRRNYEKIKKKEQPKDASINTSKLTEDVLIEYLEKMSNKQVFLLDDNEQQELIDISNSQKELSKDLEIRNREFGMLEESKDHYKAQADYFMKANDKLSTMLQKLTDTLKESVDNTRRQQTLNAKDKDII